MANRIAVKVYMADSRHDYVTGFNGTIEDARRYFVGQTLNLGVSEDLLIKCVDVEQVKEGVQQ